MIVKLASVLMSVCVKITTSKVLTAKLMIMRASLALAVPPKSRISAYSRKYRIVTNGLESQPNIWSNRTMKFAQ